MDPYDINTLLIKLKKSENTNIDKINSLCDTFIDKLKDNGVKPDDFNISISVGTGTVNIGNKMADKKIVEADVKMSGDEPETCLICFCDLDETTTILKCGHKFHRECILSWYQDQSTNDACSGNKIPRCCSYCKCDGGYLDMQIGENYIKHVHHDKYATQLPVIPNIYDISVNDEIKIGPDLVSFDLSAYKTAVKPITNILSKTNNKCNGITKKGKPCKNTKVSGKDFCYIHKK